MSSRKAIFNSGSEEKLCQKCFWLIQLPGGNCTCGVGNQWPSESDNSDDCHDYVINGSINPVDMVRVNGDV